MKVINDVTGKRKITIEFSEEELLYLEKTLGYYCHDTITPATPYAATPYEEMKKKIRDILEYNVPIGGQ